MSDAPASPTTVGWKQRRFPLLEISILFVYLAIRLIAITDTLPVFIDEATLISRARDMLHGHTFDILRRGGKWLPVALVSLLRPTGPEALWVARSIFALTATISGAVAIGLGRLLHSRLTGRLAGMLVALAPLAVIHERQALADVLMAVFVNLSLFLTVLSVKTGRWRYALVLSLTLAGASVSKLTGLMFLALPVAGAVLLGRGKRQLRQRVGPALLAVGLAGVLVAVFVVVSNQQGATVERVTNIPNTSNSFWCRHTNLCAEGKAQESSFWELSLKLPVLRDMLIYYLGWPMVALLCGLLLLLGGPLRRHVIFLFVPALMLPFGLALLAGWFPARYFNFAVASLANLAAMVAVSVWRLSRRWLGSSSNNRIVSAGLLTGLVVTPLVWHFVTGLAWIRQPYSADTPFPDSYGCWGFPYGYDRAAASLDDWRRQSTQTGQRVSIVATNSFLLQSYWGERVGAVREWDANAEGTVVDAARWLVAGDAVYFVDRTPTDPIPDRPLGTTLESFVLHPVPCNEDTVRVRRLVDAGPQVRAGIFQTVFPNPNDLAEEYRAIALHLIDSEAEGAVVVYPPHQLDLLADRLRFGTGLGGVYAIGDSWPLDASSAVNELQQLAAQYGELHVVFLEESLGDYDGVIWGWLEAEMVLVSQDWFGPIELLHYVAEEDP